MRATGLRGHVTYRSLHWMAAEHCFVGDLEPLKRQRPFGLGWGTDQSARQQSLPSPVAAIYRVDSRDSHQISAQAK